MKPSVAMISGGVLIPLIVTDDLSRLSCNRRSVTMGSRAYPIAIFACWLLLSIFKRDGSSRMSLTRERCIFLAGWLFVALCVIGFLLIAALIWSSPMGIATKLLFTVGSTAIFLFGGYTISCYSIKLFPLVKRLLANQSHNRLL